MAIRMPDYQSAIGCYKTFGVCSAAKCTQKAIKDIGLCNECLVEVRRRLGGGGSVRDFLEMTLVQNSYIYIAAQEGSDCVKIGFASAPAKRMRALQTGSSTKIDLVFSMKCFAEACEKFLHKEFKEFRQHGEWFRVDGGLALIVNEVLEGRKPAVFDEFGFDLDGCIAIFERLKRMGRP